MHGSDVVSSTKVFRQYFYKSFLTLASFHDFLGDEDSGRGFLGFDSV
jgi:hypothetical protein